MDAFQTMRPYLLEGWRTLYAFAVTKSSEIKRSEEKFAILLKLEGVPSL
jgi:hypothetical protein